MSVYRFNSKEFVLNREDGTYVLTPVRCGILPASPAQTAVGEPKCEKVSADAVSGANSRQVGGEHYRSSIQHWDYVLANNIPYLEAQIIKYVTRWRDKGGLQDLEKAKHFLEKLIEHEGNK